MKKKLLFFAPPHINIDEAIHHYIKQLDNYEVYFIQIKKYQYKNFAERVQNFFSKLFLNKNLKAQKQKLMHYEFVKQQDNYDIFLAFRPDLLDETVLTEIEKRTPIRKAVYWDSFKKIPALKDTIKYFNELYSFEKEDCINYNMKTSSNFYIEDKQIKNPEYDAFFFGAKDSRYENIKDLLLHLNKKGWNAKGLFAGKNDETLLDGCVEVTTKRTPFLECNKFSNNTKVVLDIVHNNQNGLSMRPYEALGLNRKLITNNIHIKEYDFYLPENIYIVEDFNNINIPDDFLETPYKEIPEAIKEKYYITNWLLNILK